MTIDKEHSMPHLESRVERQGLESKLMVWLTIVAALTLFIVFISLGASVVRGTQDSFGPIQLIDMSQGNVFADFGDWLRSFR